MRHLATIALAFLDWLTAMEPSAPSTFVTFQASVRADWEQLHARYLAAPEEVRPDYGIATLLASPERGQEPWWQARRDEASAALTRNPDDAPAYLVRSTAQLITSKARKKWMTP